MTLAMMKEHDFSLASETAAKKSTRWQQLLINWLATHSSMRRQWEHFETRSQGHRVPYRVWLRHSAYLEMHRESRKH